MIKAILQNIPALIVALPIFIAPILAIIPSGNKLARNIIWNICFLSFGLSLAGSAYLFAVVYQTGPFNYFFGAWSPPIGIEYEATKLNTLLLLLISSMAFILMPFGKVAVENEISHKKTGIFYAVFLLMVAGLMGMVITNDIFNIFVFMEISSLATYALVSLGTDRRALTASYNYLIVGSIGGTLFLTGIAFLYVLTGSLNISDISYQLSAYGGSKLEVAAIAFIFIGLAIKGGIVPLAGWLPRVYAYAPTFVIAFVSAVSTKVPLYILAKVFYVLFGKEIAMEQFAFGGLLTILGIIAILYGAIAAIMNTDFRRVLAFSSISNIGYIVLGIGLGSKLAVTAAILLFIAHALAISGMFVISGIAGGSVKGLKTSPMIAAIFVLFGLSLIGTPLTFGFIPKWYFLVSAAELHNTLKVIVFAGLIGGALLSIIYVWKLIESAYGNNAAVIKTSIYSNISLWVLAISIILFGLFSTPLIEYVIQLAGEFAK